MSIMQVMKMHVSGRFAIQVEQIDDLQRNFYVADMWTLSRTKLKFDKESKGTVVNLFWMNETQLAVVDKSYGRMKQLIYEVNPIDCTATRKYWRLLSVRSILETFKESEEVVINGEFFSVFVTQSYEHFESEFIIVGWSDGKEYKMGVQGSIITYSTVGSKLYWLDRHNDLNCMNFEKYRLNTERINISRDTEGYSVTQLRGENRTHHADSREYGVTIQLVGTHLFTISFRSIVFIFDLLSNGEQEGQRVLGTHVMELGQRLIFLSTKEDRIVITGCSETHSSTNLKSMSDLARTHVLQKKDLSQTPEYLRFVFPFDRYCRYKKVVTDADKPFVMI